MSESGESLLRVRNGLISNDIEMLKTHKDKSADAAGYKRYTRGPLMNRQPSLSPSPDEAALPLSQPQSPRSAASNTAIDLPYSRVIAYAFGHVLNDLCAACWFSYLLVLLPRARGIIAWKAGIVMLAGQLADAVATPLCGIYSDKSKGLSIGAFSLGRRQTWYLWGTILVAINYFFVFGIALPVEINPDVSEAWLLVYYCSAASLFNVGWACVQVTHMALVPELSRNEHTRVVLNSARYSENVIASVVVFVALYVFTTLDWTEIDQFTWLAYITLAIGLISSVIFILGTTELPQRSLRSPLASRLNSPAATDSSVLRSSKKGIDDDNVTVNEAGVLSPKHDIVEVRNNGILNENGIAHSDGNNDDNHDDEITFVPSGWSEWLVQADFYKVGWVYMTTRIVVNVSQVFLPFYVLDTLQLHSKYITIVPCVVYISSFLSALVMKQANKLFGRKAVFILGSLFCCIALLILYILTADFAQYIYIPAILLGFGYGMITVCSTQLTADLIGQNTEHGAFVYGAFSFTDKLANGIALFFLQANNQDIDCEDPETNAANGEYIRYAVTIGPFVAAVLALAVVMCGLNIEDMIARGKEGYDEEEFVQGDIEDSRVAYSAFPGDDDLHDAEVDEPAQYKPAIGKLVNGDDRKDSRRMTEETKRAFQIGDRAGVIRGDL